MRKYQTAVLISVLTGLLASAGLAQSLGDAAREQRQKKPSKSTTTPPKVITNDDIPPSGSSVAPSKAPVASNSPASTPSGPQASSPAAANVPQKPPASDDPKNYDDWAKAGKEWKARILEQKAKVQSLQSYIDKLKSSVHFAARNPDYDATVINMHELQKVDEAKRLEKQLNEENSALQNMQEAASAAGYDGSISNPRDETGNSTPPAGFPQN